MPTRDAPDGAKRTRVISVGTLPELLLLREAVLQQAGFRTFTASTPAEALLEIADGDCGVLLLCYSIPQVARAKLIEQYRDSCPDGRIVAISNERMDRPAEADTLVYGIEGPEALIAAVGGGSA